MNRFVYFIEGSFGYYKIKDFLMTKFGILVKKKMSLGYSFHISYPYIYQFLIKLYIIDILDIKF